MPVKTLEQLQTEKAALECRLDWIVNNGPCPRALLDTRVRLNNLNALIKNYNGSDPTPNPPGAVALAVPPDYRGD